MNTGSFLTHLRYCVRPPLCVLGCVTFAGRQAPYAALLLPYVSPISRSPFLHSSIYPSQPLSSTMRDTL